MDVIMPKMGESVSEGTIIKWHKKKGDKVKRDETILEISTDKVDTEIPSPSDGILSEIKVQEGDTVEVGTVIAVIKTNGEESKEEKKPAPEEAKQSKEQSSDDSKKIKEEEKTHEIKSENNAESDDSQGEVVEIKMPKMGESVMEGTIIKWHKKKGETIKKDETLYEISTDKVDTEVPSPISGTVSEILVAEQETVEVGTVVAKVSSGKVAAKKQRPKESDEPESLPEQKEEKPAPAETKSSEVKTKEAISEEKPRQKEKTAEAASSKFYSPLVMSIAQKENITYDELEKINGSGLDGRVTKKDILSYIENRGRTEPKQAEQKPEKKIAESVLETETEYSSGEVEKVQMDNIRQKIMQHMIRSRDISVHVSAMLEVDMAKIYNFLKKHKEEYQKKEGIKLTYLAFIANAAVKALREFPLVNSSIEGSTIIKKKYINLGIAVAIEPTGLIVPNIKNAGEKNIPGLAKAINDAAHRARNKKLSPDDISGGTFTITNYGVFGTVFGTPIINQPEVAILGVGAIAKKPVVVEVDGTDTIAIKPIMALTLSHDHRLVDGMLGGKFLMAVKETLENFDENSL